MSNFFYFILIILTILSLALIGFLGYVVWDTTQSIEPELPISEDENNGDANDDSNIDDNDINIDNSTIIKLNALLDELKRPKIAVLIYHHLDPYMRDNPVTITPQLFASHLRALQSSTYQALTYRQLTRFITISEQAKELSELERNLTDEEIEWIDSSYRYISFLPDFNYHITFDDGYESNYTYAFPMLRDAKIPATFFAIVQSSFKQHQTAPDWINFPHFAWEQLRLVQRLSYFEVQSHTYSLHRYESIGGKMQPVALGPKYRSDIERVETYTEFETRLFQDLVLSKSYLENRLRPHVVDGLTFPYGSWNETIIAQAKKAGIRYMFTTQKGVVDNNTVPELIPRIDVGSPNTSANMLIEILDAEFSK